MSALCAVALVVQPALSARRGIPRGRRPRRVPILVPLIFMQAVQAPCRPASAAKAECLVLVIPGLSADTSLQACSGFRVRHTDSKLAT